MSILGDETSASTITPFDNPAEADLTIRSSDGVDFYVYKLFMSVSSPVFKDMLALPQPSQQSEGKLPVVEVGDDSEVLNNLLPFVDPRASPPSELSLDQTMATIRAATKYQMERVRNDRLAPLLGEFVASDPIKVYLAAAEVAASEN